MVRKLIHRGLLLCTPILLIYFQYEFNSLNVEQYKAYLNNPVTEYLHELLGACIFYYVGLLVYACYDIIHNARTHRWRWLCTVIFFIYFGLFIYLEKFILSRPSSAKLARDELKQVDSSVQPESDLPVHKLMLRRASAVLIDYGLFAIFISVLFHYFAEQNNNGNVLSGIPALIVMVVWFIYFPFVEAIAGRTLGKGIFGLRVVRRTGSGPIFRQTILRHVFDCIDIFIFSMFAFFPTRQESIPRRIGDRIAKTWVIHQYLSAA